MLVHRDPLLRFRGIPVAHPDHPLHKLGRSLTVRDLRRYRRILIRDTSTQRRREVSGVELRWSCDPTLLPDDKVLVSERVDEVRDGTRRLYRARQARL